MENYFHVRKIQSWENSIHLINFLTYALFDGGRLSNISYPMMMIVVLGPIIEERIGSIQLAFISILTILINGILYSILFTQKLYGPTCVAYMMILLAYFVNIKKGERPISFILILLVIILVNGDQAMQNFRDVFSIFIGTVCGIFWAAIVQKVQSHPETK